MEPSTSAVGTSSDAPSTTTTSNELATAQFAVVTLALLGTLALIAGGAIGLAEITDVKTTVDPSTDTSLTTQAGTSSGMSAVLIGLSEFAKALGSALKGLTTSIALVLIGGLLLVTSGMVAWQTIPGTDKSPTITVTQGDEPESSTTTMPTADGSTEPTSSTTPTDGENEPTAPGDEPAATTTSTP